MFIIILLPTSKNARNLIASIISIRANPCLTFLGFLNFLNFLSFHAILKIVKIGAVISWLFGFARGVGERIDPTRTSLIVFRRCTIDSDQFLCYILKNYLLLRQ